MYYNMSGWFILRCFVYINPSTSLYQRTRQMNSHIPVAPSTAGALNSVVRLPASVHNTTQRTSNILATAHISTIALPVTHH